MNDDRVSIDGVVATFGETRFSPDELFASNFIYQKLHALAGRPLHAEWATEIAGDSAETLYAQGTGLTPELLEKETAALLAANRYPSAASVLVSLYLVPNAAEERFSRLLSCEKQLIFKGYSLRTGARCLVVPYDPPLAHHKTAASLATHSYAADYVRCKGFDGAVARNADGALTGMGEWPLFAIAGNKALTPSPLDGVPDSIERRLGITVCTDAGLIVCEHRLTLCDAADYDELFAVTPAGITSIRQIVAADCSSRLLPHSMAAILLPHLKKYER